MIVKIVDTSELIGLDWIAAKCHVVQSINQSIIYLPEKNNTSRTQRLQNNTNKCPKTSVHDVYSRKTDKQA